LDPHRDSISSRFDCSYNTMPIDLPKSWTEADGAWDPQGVSRPFPSWNWYISTEIHLCHACSCQEILRTETAGQVNDNGEYWELPRTARLPTKPKSGPPTLGWCTTEFVTAEKTADLSLRCNLGRRLL
jgi:hypothetical protein